jgi:hypothetical protein
MLYYVSKICVIPEKYTIVLAFNFMLFNWAFLNKGTVQLCHNAEGMFVYYQ